MKFKLEEIAFFGGITFLVIVTLIYGLSLIPSPLTEQARQLDRQRATDITNLSSRINDFAKQYGRLPDSIAEAAPTSDIAKLDPETQEPYQYIKVDQHTYSLCTTFTTDTMTKTQKNDYSFTDSTNDVKHPQGSYCFSYTPISATPSFNLDSNSLNFLKDAAAQFLKQ